MNTQTNINGQGLAAQKSALDRSAGLKPAFRSTLMHLPPLGYGLLKPRAFAVRCAVIFLVSAFAGFGSLEIAQAFDCGSTGAYGPMNITSNTTLQLPPDGIFNCTTITVAAGKTLRFTNNALNTPVYMLATGDVAINGTIDVSGSPGGYTPGRGGPGGFDGGWGGSVISGQSRAGDGQGPGGGIATDVRQGVYAGSARSYGSILLDPLIGGSGSAGRDGTPGLCGNGGGGAILIASNLKITINGTICSDGSSGDQGRTGSGGAIRLVAPVVTGIGLVSANQAQGYFSGYNFSEGNFGRIRIDCTDNQAYRTLTLAGITSRGSRMIVFSNLALDITAVGGQPVATGTNSAVVIELAVGASTNQTVTVQARNFTNDVPIRVVVTPENGPRGEFDATILQSSGNPPSANVPVIIPAGSACQIHVWTR